MKSMIKHIILVTALAAASFAQSDADTIIERSVEANAADWKVAPDYDYVCLLYTSFAARLRA